ncbi:MAG TPA: hypothetical protein VMF31_10655 [Solirubrobacterales bacterium]|nr:hypothetical protein [Solirubrobacterales bacterium]
MKQQYQVDVNLTAQPIAREEQDKLGPYIPSLHDVEATITVQVEAEDGQEAIRVGIDKVRDMVEPLEDDAPEGPTFGPEEPETCTDSNAEGEAEGHTTGTMTLDVGDLVAPLGQLVITTDTGPNGDTTITVSHVLPFSAVPFASAQMRY